MLHARALAPIGGNTEFADTRAAYDASPDRMKRRLDGPVEHSLWHSRVRLDGYVPTEEERRAYPVVRHELVRRHPGSGRKARYIAARPSHAVGMPVDEGQALIDGLIAFATQPRFVCSHAWQVGDLAIWHHRRTMHRVTPFAAGNEGRERRRPTVIDMRAGVAAQ